MSTPSIASPSVPPELLGSLALDWAKLAVTPTPIGERRGLFDGPTATFANAEGHVTTLHPGETPHEPHRHSDEELIIVKEGLIEVSINGQASHAGAGSVFFFASGDLHGLRNAGPTAATYFVFRFLTPACAGPALKA
jgi:quercetin dioxygenase-like cupin family protein